ncbi:hypothetical protein GO755_28610 [Spirosoma sp. HMF4905]|uniref:Uncharacterized protein n=1 Tax=Spirosoma arboris TaxID=2682092 RepID=A0A7K1SJP4_9BACT|nr:hypothetical protein [Spirosoma arboris]MVM34029.1 hypothetical protein [Spirosoma arboris]
MIYTGKYFRSFEKAYSEAHYQFYLQLIDKPFDEAKQNILYMSNPGQDFMDEFDEVLRVNLSNPAWLKTYVEDVYYEGVISLLKQFEELSAEIIMQNDFSISQSIKDSSFLLISNGYISSLIGLASHIRKAATRFGLVSLKHDVEITEDDFSITNSGRNYIPLHKSSEQSAKQQEDQQEHKSWQESKSQDQFVDYTTPSAAPSPSSPPLFILQNSKQALYDDLCLFIDDADHLTLQNLINRGDMPKNHIVVTCQVKAFGLTFFEAGAVPEQGAKLLSEQIPNFFVRNDGMNIVSFKPSILVKYLRGKDKDK